MEPQPERIVPSGSLASYTQLLRVNGNYRRLWLAQIVSEIGDWFYTLSIYTLLLQLTGHASSVALALVLQVLPQTLVGPTAGVVDRKSTRLNSSHSQISYAVFCLKKKIKDCGNDLPSRIRSGSD